MGWQVILLLGLQYLERKTKLSCLSWACPSPSSSWLCALLPFEKLHLCFAYYLLVLTCKWTLLNAEAAPWIGKAGIWKDLYLCWWNCVRVFLWAPSMSATICISEGWLPIGGKRRMLHFFQLNVCGLITAEKSMYYVSVFK